MSNYKVEKYVVTKKENDKDYFWDWVLDNWREDLFPPKNSLMIFSSKDEANNCLEHAKSIVSKDNVKIQKIRITVEEEVENETF